MHALRENSRRHFIIIDIIFIIYFLFKNVLFYLLLEKTKKLFRSYDQEHERAKNGIIGGVLRRPYMIQSKNNLQMIEEKLQHKL